MPYSYKTRGNAENPNSGPRRVAAFATLTIAAAAGRSACAVAPFLSYGVLYIYIFLKIRNVLPYAYPIYPPYYLILPQIQYNPFFHTFIYVLFVSTQSVAKFHFILFVIYFFIIRYV